MRIYLIGFMGAGKSHVGRQLAQLFGWPFHDLDKVIEEDIGMSIADFFAFEGEEAFRQVERKALQQTSCIEHGIFATGGGAPCFYDNMEWMRQHGLTVYLDAPVPILWERLRRGKAHRPLLKNKTDDELYQYIEMTLSKRRPFYEKASVSFHIRHAEQEVAQILFDQFIQIIGH